MSGNPIRVERLPERLSCDPTRTIVRFFWPDSEGRARKIIDRVVGMDDQAADGLLDQVGQDFGDAHADLARILRDHYQEAMARAAAPYDSLPAQRQLLIGAYFSMEYAHESAALFNPSMAPAFRQDDVPTGSVRFVMSLRAVGEGHLSSIAFRQGIIDSQGNVTIESPNHQSCQIRPTAEARHNKDTFLLKVIEAGLYHPLVDGVLEKLYDDFTIADLTHAIASISPGPQDQAVFETVGKSLLWLAESNYEVRFDPNGGLAELVLFPISEAESQGMEDMRLVRFRDEEGPDCFYGTYTAYNGRQILPQLLECPEPGVARVHTLSGACVRNKGMALFPRKLDGWYAMIGRMDGENLYFLRSDGVRFWNDAELIQEPAQPWEFMLIGNCGPPIETEAGWLLLTHGVGPMRRYCMGASLLDLNDPRKVIGQLDHPLLEPEADERSGYVPNVVYSCGAMAHNGHLIIPYGISDAATGFARVSLTELLTKLAP